MLGHSGNSMARTSSLSVLYLLQRHQTHVAKINSFIAGPARWLSGGVVARGRHTPLYDLHVAHKGKMVVFGGFDLPIQYGSDGIAASHRHTRAHCSLFDVSHMLQTQVRGKDRVEFFESICTADVEGLPDESGCLSLFTNESGGILDDLIVSKTSEGYLYVVSNAGRRDNDQALILKAQDEYRSRGKDVSAVFLEPQDQALVALQGPEAWRVLQPLVDFDLTSFYFMMTRSASVSGIPCRVTRCGYTGEDGFEISIPGRAASAIVEDLLKSSVAPVKLAGLGARDTLRLEAGLCLYGNDIDDTTTPVSAALAWTIGKRRRQTKDFPGADLILGELKDKPARRRVGLKSERRGPPARPGARVTDQEMRDLGVVTSGCPSPSLGHNIAMGYVDSSHASPGTQLHVMVRDSPVPVVVCKMPFVESKYYVKK